MLMTIQLLWILLIQMLLNQNLYQAIKKSCRFGGVIVLFAIFMTGIAIVIFIWIGAETTGVIAVTGVVIFSFMNANAGIVTGIATAIFMADAGIHGVIVTLCMAAELCAAAWGLACQAEAV